MAIVNAIPNGQMGAADYCRTMYILAGGDKITSGLRMAHNTRRTVQIAEGSGAVGGVAFTNTQTEFFTSDLEPSANPRFDRLVARKTIVPGTPATSTTPAIAAYPKVEFAIMKGTPAADPQLPPLTYNHDGVWEFGLGYWLVAGNNVQTIPNGLVWGHYANLKIDQYVESIVGGAIRNVQPGQPGYIYETPGSNVIILAVPNDFRIPGAGKVRITVLVTIYIDGKTAGSVTVRSLGKSATKTFSIRYGDDDVYPGHITVPVTLHADVNPGGGTAAVEVEAAVPAGVWPVRVTHVSADLVQVMP